MNKFLKYTFFFMLPFLLFIPMELSLHNNTFKAKKEYIDQNKVGIELLQLGSSHNWNAINPEFLSIKTAPLGHGGNGHNMDMLLFDKFFPNLPNLEYVIFDISCGYFENKIPVTSNKNHMYYLFYGINNYGENPPLKDNLLLTSNPKNYIDKFISKVKNPNASQFNKYGFVTKTPNKFNKYENLNYDPKLIKEAFDLELIIKHSNINDEIYLENTTNLDQAIQRCIDRNIKVILLSTPKYYLYTQNFNQEIIRRRNKYLNKYQNSEHVYIWNFETIYERNPTYFKNDNHLNVHGAETFTKMLDQRLLDLN